METGHADPSDRATPNPEERGAGSAMLTDLRMPPAVIGVLLIMVVVMAVIFLVAAQNVHTL